MTLDIESARAALSVLLIIQIVVGFFCDGRGRCGS